MNIKRTPGGYSLNRLEASGLTARESQALLLLASGLPFAQIAQHMGTSLSSAKARIANVAHKLRLPGAGKAQVIAAAFMSGKLRAALALLAALNIGIAAPAVIDTNTDLNRVARVMRSHRTTRKETA